METTPFISPLRLCIESPVGRGSTTCKKAQSSSSHGIRTPKGTGKRRYLRDRVYLGCQPCLGRGKGRGVDFHSGDCGWSGRSNCTLLTPEYWSKNCQDGEGCSRLGCEVGGSGMIADMAPQKAADIMKANRTVANRGGIFKGLAAKCIVVS